MNEKFGLSGQRFGKLCVISGSMYVRNGKAGWTCICDCGKKKDIRADALKSGRTRSCGRCKKSTETINMIPAQIREICQQSEDAGMSFGEYVAMQYAMYNSGRRNNIEKSHNRRNDKKA